MVNLFQIYRFEFSSSKSFVVLQVNPNPKEEIFEGR